MQVKAEFILETESDSAVNAIEDLIQTIFANGESILDYAFVYSKENGYDEWIELKRGK